MLFFFCIEPLPW